MTSRSSKPEAMTFETGSNQWKSYDKWPPTQGITERKLYLHSNGKRRSMRHRERSGRG